jgi:hypothetical protein
VCLPLRPVREEQRHACPIYPGKRYEDWQVDDPSEADLDGVRRIRDDIGERVRRLLADVVEPRAQT